MWPERDTSRDEHMAGIAAKVQATYRAMQKEIDQLKAELAKAQAK